MNEEAPKLRVQDREPVMIGASTVALIEAGIAVAVVMGWADWSVEQVASLMGFVGAAAILVGGWYGRERVFSASTMAQVEEDDANAIADVYDEFERRLAVTEADLDELNEAGENELEDSDDELDDLDDLIVVEGSQGESR